MKHHLPARPRSRRQRVRRALMVLGAVIVLMIIAMLIIRHVYTRALRPVSTSAKQQIVTITSGSSVNDIADLLQQKDLVRSSWAFEWFVRSQELRSDLQAGTYALAPDQSVSAIVGTLTKGKIATKLVTILPDRRLDQVRGDLINDGFAPAAVDAALQPAQYANLPALADKPPAASLEGLLYPDSFQKATTTTPTQIVRESLIEMGQHLTPALQAAFAAEHLTTYQGIILASLIQQEVKPPDQPQAAQVFLTRLSMNISLDSDASARYGAIIADQPPSIIYDSAYNTYDHQGLPPTPISNVNAGALQAAAHPAPTDWLYFVTGDNGTTYFSQTAQQQQQNTAQYCHKLCAQPSE